jgi:hypothetical protein
VILAAPSAKVTWYEDVSAKAKPAGAAPGVLFSATVRVLASMFWYSISIAPTPWLLVIINFGEKLIKEKKNVEYRGNTYS